MSHLIKNEIQNIYVKSESISSQLLSTTYQTLNGSSLIYTPHPQAKSVIYEYTFGYSWYPDDDNILQILIQQETSGTYSSLGNEWRRLTASFSNSPASVTCNMFWILDPWAGPRGIRLRSRSYSTSHEATAHVTRHYQQSSPISKEVFPVLKVYSVIGD